MKKIFLILLLFVSFMNVEAKDYEVMELIPIDEKASVTTDLFFYDNFYYDSSEEQASYLNTNTIRFDKVKNLDSKDRDISVAIGFFNSNKDNIGIHNYCSSKDVKGSNYNDSLKQNEEKSLMIEIKNEDLNKNFKLSDIAYIAIMSDNPNCKNGNNYKFVGRKAGYFEYKDVEKPSLDVLNNIVIVVILLLLVLILKFIFDVTINKDSKFMNKLYGIEVDKRSNEEIKKEYFNRREQENIEKKKEKEKGKEKEEIVDKSQEKGNTDLHNMYK